MERRSFLFQGAAATAALLASPSLASTPTFLNGELNRQTRTFDWTGGGNDPLQSRWTTDLFRRALAIPRLNLDQVTQAGLRRQMQTAPNRFSLKIYEGQVAGDVMISGNGWIALRPRVFTSRWKRGRTTMASSWSWTNTSNGERWQYVVPDVCSNPILTRLGQAVPCVCEPRVDACA